MRIIAHLQLNGTPFALQLVRKSKGLTIDICRLSGGEIDVSNGLHAVFGIYHHNRYGVIAVHYLQNKSQIGVLVGCIQRMNGLCPHFHFVAFFLRKCFGYGMRNPQ